MRARGFVLAGGQSRRMGRDKALLPWSGVSLLEHAARAVAEAAGSATVIGPPERYGHLGFPVLDDLRPGLGPLAGLESALFHTDADWNLVVACDLPDLSAAALRRLAARAAGSAAGAVVAGSREAMQPLCAFYHRRLLPLVSSQLDGNRLKMKDMIELARTEFAPECAVGANLNTPADWLAAGGARG
jgi:molybdopterin-guanine dinucleotide biosynthesis protein A